MPAAQLSGLTDHLRDTRFGQELLAEGEARGRAVEASAVALRQLNRRAAGVQRTC
jgi:hypothetical protein